MHALFDLIFMNCMYHNKRGLLLFLFLFLLLLTDFRWTQAPLPPNSLKLSDSMLRSIGLGMLLADTNESTEEGNRIEIINDYDTELTKMCNNRMHLSKDVKKSVATIHRPEDSAHDHANDDSYDHVLSRLTETLQRAFSCSKRKCNGNGLCLHGTSSDLASHSHMVISADADGNGMHSDAIDDVDVSFNCSQFSHILDKSENKYVTIAHTVLLHGGGGSDGGGGGFQSMEIMPSPRRIIPKTIVLPTPTLTSQYQVLHNERTRSNTVSTPNSSISIVLSL